MPYIPNPNILAALERQQLREFGRCREMGGGMLMVFDWHKTQEAAEAVIPEDSPVKQFVISREALNEHQS